MKIQFLLIGACCLTVSRAAYSSNQGSFNQLQGYNDHVPVIHNGVPVDTPEVQAAKAAHFEAYARAQALAAKQPSDGQYYEKTSSKGSTGVSFQSYQKPSFNSYYNQEQQYPGYTGGAQQYPGYTGGAVTFDNSGSLGGGYSSGGFGSEYTGGFSGGHNQYGNGYIPVDTPEVQHAKAAHFAAVAKAHSRSNNHYRHKRGAFYYSQQEQHIPKIVNGVPEDTPEVQAAKLQHYIAHAEASNHADDHSTSDSNLYEIYHKVNDGIYHIPIIGKAGVPLDTPEVNSARAQHHLAHYYAHTKGSETWNQHGIYSEHVPIIGPNGVPFDTAEVQIAKAKHLLAHAKESAHHNQWALSSGYGSSGHSTTSHY